MKFFKPKRIDIHEKGLAKVFGTLEAEILEFLWTKGRASAREVCNHLNQSRSISFNAVNTVLGRLIDKHIISRQKKNGCFQFSPVQSRDKMYKSISDDVFSSLLKDKKIFSVASFAGALKNLSEKEKIEILNALKKNS